MSIVAGVDFGTLSVRVSLFSKSEGRLGSGVAEYRLHRSVHEAGLSAVGGVFDGIACRAGSPVTDLTRGLEAYRAGQTGLLRAVWDNGDRTILVNPRLGGITLGWNLVHTAQDAALCPPCETFPPMSAAAAYGKLYALYRKVYFSLGSPASPAAQLGHILSRLRKIAADARFGD